MDLPIELMKLELSDSDKGYSALSAALSNIDNSTLSYVGESLGVPLTCFVFNLYTPAIVEDPIGGVNFYSNTPYRVGNQRWVTVDTVFIHLNTSFTPVGYFPLYSNESLPNSNGFRVGYDAAVCVQVYEPWIIEAYNTSTGSSFVLGVVGEGNDRTSLLSGGNIQGTQIANTRYLNTTGKDIAFSVAYQKSVTRMDEANYDQGSHTFHLGVPSPIVGPIVPLHTIFLLTSTCSTGCFFYQWYWAFGVY